jgi:hypothetical protein
MLDNASGSFTPEVEQACLLLVQETEIAASGRTRTIADIPQRGWLSRKPSSLGNRRACCLTAIDYTSRPFHTLSRSAARWQMCVFRRFCKRTAVMTVGPFPAI